MREEKEWECNMNTQIDLMSSCIWQVGAFLFKSIWIMIIFSFFPFISPSIVIITTKKKQKCIIIAHPQSIETSCWPFFFKFFYGRCVSCCSGFPWNVFFFLVPVDRSERALIYIVQDLYPYFFYVRRRCVHFKKK